MNQKTDVSYCTVCGKAFEPGDEMEALFRSASKPQGVWSTPLTIDESFQERFKTEPDKLVRKHAGCVVEANS